MSAAPHLPTDPANKNLDQQDSAEGLDVSHVHAAIMREKVEPQEGHEPMPLWLVIFIGAFLFWGGMYMQRFSGGYKPLVYDEHSSGAPVVQAVQPTVDLFAEGKRLYADTCGKCHQANGQGVPGQYPPLAESEWVNTPRADLMIMIVLDGLQGPIQVKGVTYNQAMVPWRDVFNDRQIAAVISYVRGEKEWGNTATPITPEQVAAVRAATKDRPSIGAWTAEELKAIPEMSP